MNELVGQNACMIKVQLDHSHITVSVDIFQIFANNRTNDLKFLVESVHDGDFPCSSNMSLV